MTIADKTFTTPFDIFPQAPTGQELGHAANLWDLFTREVTFGGASTANVITVPDNVASAVEWVDAGGIEYMRIDSQNAQPQVHWNIAGADIDFRWEAVGVDPALFIQGSTGNIGIAVAAPGVTLDILGAHVAGVGLARFTGTAANGFMTLDTTTGGAGDEGGFLINLGGIIHGQFGARGDDTVYIKNRVFGVADIITFTSAGNTGVGVTTPSNLFEVASGVTHGGIGIGPGGVNQFINWNSYFTGAQWDRIKVGFGAFQMYHTQSTDVFTIRIADSGANPITWTHIMTMDLAGNVGIGTTGPLAKLHVDQLSTTAAIPVLYLDQADVSEEMIEMATTIGVGNAIEAVGAKTLTTTHFIKITIPGPLTRYIPCGTIA